MIHIITLLYGWTKKKFVDSTKLFSENNFLILICLLLINICTKFNIVTLFFSSIQSRNYPIIFKLTLTISLFPKLCISEKFIKKLLKNKTYYEWPITPAHYFFHY